jgi:hypothetical protein
VGLIDVMYVLQPHPQTIIKENRVHQALKNKKSECSFAVSVCEYHQGPPPATASGCSDCVMYETSRSPFLSAIPVQQYAAFLSRQALSEARAELGLQEAFFGSTTQQLPAEQAVAGPLAHAKAQAKSESVAVGPPSSPKTTARWVVVSRQGACRGRAPVPPRPSHCCACVSFAALTPPATSPPSEPRRLQ